MHSLSQDPLRIAARARYWKKPDHYRAKSRQCQKRNPVRAAIYRYKSCSKRKGLIWDLDDRHAEDLLTDNCYYCGSSPLPCNGIDRVDNARGYESDNVVTACLQCNIGKNDYTREEFLDWTLRVARRNHDFS